MYMAIQHIFNKFQKMQIDHIWYKIDNLLSQSTSN